MASASSPGTVVTGPERMPKTVGMERMPAAGTLGITRGTASARHQLRKRLRLVRNGYGANLTELQRRDVLSALDEIESLAREVSTILSAR